MHVDQLDQWLSEATAAIAACPDAVALDKLRVEYLGRKGTLTAYLHALGELPAAERRAAGQAVNQAKQQIIEALAVRRAALEQAALDRDLEAGYVDVTLPGRGQRNGTLHPVATTLERMTEIFKNLGFAVASGPEIEDDEHNFAALNFPPHHPARAMHDTFYLPDGRLLRTHTSPVQIRALRRDGAPLRIIAPGRVYRSDSDQTHTPMFHQLEGLLVAENVSFADLKGVLQAFVNLFFERQVPLRLRPSYFPFTEPSAEVDIGWQKADGSTGWLEVLGCGMVHPNVLANCGVDNERYTGYAFGMGVERLAMLRFGVTDLRQFFENDLRFLRQFG